MRQPRLSNTTGCVAYVRLKSLISGFRPPHDQYTDRRVGVHAGGNRFAQPSSSPYGETHIFRSASSFEAPQAPVATWGCSDGGRSRSLTAAGDETRASAIHVHRTHLTRYLALLTIGRLCTSVIVMPPAKSMLTLAMSRMVSASFRFASSFIHPAALSSGALASREHWSFWTPVRRWSRLHVSARDSDRAPRAVRDLGLEPQHGVITQAYLDTNQCRITVSAFGAKGRPMQPLL